MCNLNIKSVTAGIYITLLVCAIVFAFSQTRFMQKNEWLIYDWLMQYKRQNTPLPDDIAVILVDDISLKNMDSVVGQWPWPRSVFADIIDFIALGQPKAVLMDIIFSEKSKAASSDDQRLIHATRNAGNVYHAMQLITDEPDELNSTGDHTLPEYIMKQFSLPKFSQSQNKQFSSKFNNYIIPIKGLYRNAKGLGVVAFNKDHDGVHRRTQLIFDYRGKWYPALSVTAVSEQMDKLPATPAINNHLFESPDTQSEISPVMVNMYGEIESLSMSGILDSITNLKNGEVDKLVVDPQEFENKYVFIGTSAAGLYDLKTSSINTNTPGVYLHASLLGNLLHDDLLKPVDNRINILAILLSAFFTTLGILASRQLRMQIFIPAIILLTTLLSVLVSYQYNWVINVASVLVSGCLAWAFSFVYLLFTESKEKTRLKRTFSRYLSPAALAVIEKDYEKYLSIDVGSKETGTILFCDIRGFTSFSESHEPYQVVEFLNFYFSNMTKVIHEHNGAIDKFIGDAIMAFWGIPIMTKTHAEDAVNAAIKMVEQLQVVNNWLESKHLDQISIGIGIHTGDVILGSIGSEDRADFTAIGDNVNLASRLEGATKHYSSPIIISEATYKCLRNRIACRLIDTVKVKGKSQPVKIYSPIVGLSEFEAHKLQNQIELAFSCYMQGHWDAAISYYESLPDHPINKIIIDRCNYYRSEPPPENWDGAYSMIAK